MHVNAVLHIDALTMEDEHKQFSSVFFFRYAVRVFQYPDLKKNDKMKYTVVYQTRDFFTIDV
jgi:hypothetical protein